MYKEIKKNNFGYTLVEIMVALAVATILLGGAMGVYRWQKKTATMQDHVATMQQTLRAAVGLMNRELREAKYSPLSNAGEITEITATAISFNFEFQDNSETLRTIRYSHYDQSGNGVPDTLGRNIGGAAVAPVPLAENVEAVEFLYLDANGIQTANSDEIEAITVSILIRAEREDMDNDFVNSIDYYPASCPQPGGGLQVDNCIVANGLWDFDRNVGNNRNAFNDRFRRRLLVNTIKLRN